LNRSPKGFWTIRITRGPQCFKGWRCRTFC